MPKRHYDFEFWVTPKIIQERKDLTPTDKDVLSVFITRYNGEAPLKMKQETIAAYIGSTERSVIRSIKRLKEKGFIEMGKSWKLNTYKITGRK